MARTGKADSEMPRRLLDSLSVAAEAALMIGPNLKCDIATAQVADLRGILQNVVFDARIHIIDLCPTLWGQERQALMAGKNRNKRRKWDITKTARLSGTCQAAQLRTEVIIRT